MTWEEFLKGIAVLYHFGLKEQPDLVLKVWHTALKVEMSFDYYKQACAYLCKYNVKFWDNDNIPAQLIAAYNKIKKDNEPTLIAQHNQDEQERRDRERQEANDSYDSPEDRLKCIKEFGEMSRKTFKEIPE